MFRTGVCDASVVASQRFADGGVGDEPAGGGGAVLHVILAVGLAGGARRPVLFAVGVVALVSPWFAPALVTFRGRAAFSWTSAAVMVA